LVDSDVFATDESLDPPTAKKSAMFRPYKAFAYSFGQNA
jgi:hypothetical protein